LELAEFLSEQEEPMRDQRAGWSRRLLDPIRDYWQGDRDLAELATCTAEDVQRMARDVGVDGTTLRALAARGPHAADLLSTRLAALQLDPQRIADRDPGTLRDLERVCAFCHEKRHCATDLGAGVHTVSGYCPNAPTLNALLAEVQVGTVH
jgi:hypothetical protein